MKGIEQPISNKANDVAKQVEAFVQKKEQPKDVEDKYQEVCNLQYVKNADVRKELKQLIDELEKIKELSLQKTSNHDLSVRFKGRQLVKVCPLKKGWSAQLKGGKVQSYTKDQILSGVRDLMTEPQVKNQDDKTVIKKLEERIAKLSKGSKGIKIKGIKVTSEIKKWIEEKGYTLTKDTLVVNRAE